MPTRPEPDPDPDSGPEAGPGPASAGPPDERLARALARVDALVDWEKRDRSPWVRRGIEPAQDLMERLGRPERSFRAVHVAGTKGKGSTAALVAAGLARAGLSVGVYTSPHVDRVEERVRVDGRDVEPGVLAEALERTLAAREAAVREATPGDASTWFDVLTAAAFVVFRDAGVAWGVIECGLGGRLDSTNVVHGEVCVVTNVDLEHTAVLGDRYEAIAREKGGILEGPDVLVTGVRPGDGRPAAEPPDDPNAVLEELAAARGARLVRPEEPAGGEPRSAQARNLALARAVLDELGRPHGADGRIARDADGRPLSGAWLDAATAAGARLPGRLERLAVSGVPVVVDGAHVASSVTLLLDELVGPEAPAGAEAGTPEAPGDLVGRPVGLVALGRDKDAPAVLKALRARADTVVCTTVSSGPLRPASELRALAVAEGFEAEAIEEPDAALARALALAHAAGGWLLVIGSFYLAGAVRAALRTGSGVGPTEPPC